MCNASNKSKPKPERCFYLSRGGQHPRDSVLVVTYFGLTSDTQNVARELGNVPTIAAAPDVETAPFADVWDVGDCLR